jgi:sugar phosphate isomerase/epimerase
VSARHGRPTRFRLGTTSFIWPDRMAPNVRRLGPLVDDVELLLFSVDEDLPDAAEVAELAALGREHALSFSVHTPLDASLASEDEARRQLGVARVRRAIEWGQPLAPSGYPVHVYLGDGEHDPAPPRDLDAWRARATRSLEALLLETGVAPRALCVECLDYDFALVAPVVRALGLSMALDVGHLMRDGCGLAAALDTWLPLARLIQLHGTRPDGRDHVSLAYAPRAEVAGLLRVLDERGWDGVLTLEVFSERDLLESLALVRELRGG